MKLRFHRRMMVARAVRKTPAERADLKLGWSAYRGEGTNHVFPEFDRGPLTTLCGISPGAANGEYHAPGYDTCARCEEMLPAAEKRAAAKDAARFKRTEKKRGRLIDKINMSLQKLEVEDLEQILIDASSRD